MVRIGASPAEGSRRRQSRGPRSVGERVKGERRRTPALFVEPARAVEVVDERLVRLALEELRTGRL